MLEEGGPGDMWRRSRRQLAIRQLPGTTRGATDLEPTPLAGVFIFKVLERARKARHQVGPIRTANRVAIPARLFELPVRLVPNFLDRACHRQLDVDVLSRDQTLYVYRNFLTSCVGCHAFTFLPTLRRFCNRTVFDDDRYAQGASQLCIPMSMLFGLEQMVCITNPFMSLTPKPLRDRRRAMTPNELYKEVGSRVRRARLRAGLSQGDLASSTGLTRTSIVNVESGRQRVPLHRLFDIARVLQVTPEELLPVSSRPHRPARRPLNAATLKKLSALPGDERNWIKELLETARER
jgi:transcriptional regulator with XRE-family HTH domain